MSANRRVNELFGVARALETLVDMAVLEMPSATVQLRPKGYISGHKIIVTGWRQPEESADRKRATRSGK